MTPKQKAIIDWQTNEGADVWYANAIAVFGVEQAASLMASKADRYTAAYDAAVDKRPKAQRE